MNRGHEHSCGWAAFRQCSLPRSINPAQWGIKFTGCIELTTITNKLKILVFICTLHINVHDNPILLLIYISFSFVLILSHTVMQIHSVVQLSYIYHQLDV